MAYTALYRKFRPLKFEDMVGQEHITKTLRNQIIADRVGHAYLFNGGRGTGKTTAAKILARAVNCLNPKDGEPCNECDICKEILSGSLTDVVEMDAASNNGVDDVREIREEVNFLPTKAKYRVYIIDEVHMLSTGAFNALLKTLEEPPEHVKFILATTEPQKIPTTILSRCQRFDFKKIGNEDIIKRLKIICSESEIKISDDALKTIAILSEGAMRDAISILERCAQENIDEINVKDIKDLVGLPSIEYINKVAEGIASCDETKALEGFEDIKDAGKDIYNFLWELIKYLKDVLIYKATNKLELYSEDELELVKKLADQIDKERLVKIIYDLSETANEIKWSGEKSIIVEVALIKACRKEIFTNTTGNSTGGNLEKRFELLEEEIKKLQEMMSVGVDLHLPYKENSKKSNEVVEKEKVKKEQESLVNSTIQEKWKKVIENIKNAGRKRLSTILLSTRIEEVNELTWNIIFPNGIASTDNTVLQDNNSKEFLKNEIHKAVGKEILFHYIDGKQKENTKTNDKNNMKDIDFDVRIIE